MSTEWLKDDLWRAHVSWVTPAWVEKSEVGRNDFDAVQWMDQLQAAHYQTLIFYSKFHNGICTYPSKYTDFHTDRDFLGECTAEVRKRGMRIVTYFSSVLDQSAGTRHPDWKVVDREGKFPVGWYSRQWPDAYCCINHPEFRAFVLGQIVEIQENYNVDSMWLDVYAPLLPENCFCPFCREKYHIETGGDLADTHDNLWYRSCYLDFYREIKSAIQKINPDSALTNNGQIYDDLDDYYSTEAFIAPAISAYCRAVRPLGKPFETTSRLFSMVHSWAVRGQDRVLLESMATVVHGGASCMEVQPYPTGAFVDEALHNVGAAGKHIRELEPYLIHNQPVYDVGVFQKGISFWRPDLDSWLGVFLERDIPFARLYPDGDLSSYRLVVVDGSMDLTEDLAKRLADYVHAGGNLIVECDAAGFGNAVGDILSPVLGIQSLGKTGGAAHYISELDERIAQDMGVDDLIVEGEAQKVATTTATPLAWYRYEILDRRGIRDLYMNLPPIQVRSNDPVITVNQYGLGKAMYIACPLSAVEIHNHRSRWDECREYPTQLASNLARFMLGEPLLRGTTPPGVEVVVNQQGNRHIVNLLNFYVGGQYRDNRPGLMKLADVPVSINEKCIGHITKASRVVGTELIDLPIHRDGPWAEVRIPEMTVHELVVLEHG